MKLRLQGCLLFLLLAVIALCSPKLANVLLIRGLLQGIKTKRGEKNA